MSTIAVSGLGYVGLSLAVLLARHHRVIGLDLDEARLDLVRQGVSPIHDDDISNLLPEGDLDLTVTSDPEEAYRDAEFVIIATPTDYDPETNYFDTSSVEAVVSDVTQAQPGRHDGHQVDDPGRLRRCTCGRASGSTT